MLDLEEAESFEKWVKVDLRRLSNKGFEEKLNEFRILRENEE